MQESFDQNGAYEPQQGSFVSHLQSGQFYSPEGQDAAADGFNGEFANGAAPYDNAPGPYGGNVPLSYYDYNPHAFHVQSGVNGYLVPQLPSTAVATTEKREPSLAELLGPLISSTLTGVMPSSTRQLSAVLRRSMAFLTSLFSVTLFGGSVTTAICYLTPLCTISFALPLALPFIGLRSSVKRVVDSMNFGETQANQIMLATDLVESAIRKIQSMQKTGEKTAKSAVDNSQSETALYDSIGAAVKKAEAAEKEVAAAAAATEEGNAADKIE